VLAVTYYTSCKLSRTLPLISSHSQEPEDQSMGSSLATGSPADYVQVRSLMYKFSTWHGLAVPSNVLRASVNIQQSATLICTTHAGRLTVPHIPERTTANAALLCKDLRCGTVFLLYCAYGTCGWTPSETNWRYFYAMRNYDAMPSLTSLKLSNCRIIAFCCWYITLRRDLDLWSRDLYLLPLTLNICHVMKLHTKFKRNRTIRSGVIAISMFDLMT